MEPQWSERKDEERERKTRRKRHSAAVWGKKALIPIGPQDMRI